MKISEKITRDINKRRRQRRLNKNRDRITEAVMGAGMAHRRRTFGARDINKEKEQ